MCLWVGLLGWVGWLWFARKLSFVRRCGTVLLLQVLSSGCFGVSFGFSGSVAFGVLLGAGF